MSKLNGGIGQRETDGKNGGLRPPRCAFGEAIEDSREGRGVRGEIGRGTARWRF